MAQTTPGNSFGLPAGKPLFLLHPSHSKSQALAKGTVYIVAGTAQFGLIEGRVTVAGKIFVPGDSFTVPRGRALPVEALSDAVVRIKLGSYGSVTRAAGRTIPADWDLLVTRIIAEKKRTLLLLGDTDTGKTFFATYLANRLAGLGTSVAFLDGDTGQSVVGPPGTVGLALIQHPVLFPGMLKPAALYFTGSSSPGASFMEFGLAINRMMKKARTLADTVIVNTPGWVQGDGGRLLVRAQAELLSPDLLILFQRGNELSYAVRRFPDKTAVLSVPEAIPSRSADERRFLREQATKDYFKNVRNIDLPFRQVTMDRSYLLSGSMLKSSDINRVLHSRTVLRAERLGNREGVLVVSRRPLTLDQLLRIRSLEDAARVKNIVAGDEQGVVVALNDRYDNVLALGVIQKIEYARGVIRVLTPLPARQKKKVRILQFGQMKMTPAGAEAGTVEPGYF